MIRTAVVALVLLVGGQAQAQYSNAIDVSYPTSSVAAACGTFYLADTLGSGGGGPITVTLPAASACPAGSAVTIKKKTMPAHGGQVIINPTGSDTLETLSQLVTEKNGAVARLVTDGISQWTLDGDYYAWSGTIVPDHHSIAAGWSFSNPWPFTPSTMGGEILGADPSTAGSGVMLNLQSLTGATLGYVPQTWWFGNFASGVNPPGPACFRYLGGTLMQAVTPECLDGYGSAELHYTDGQEVKILMAYDAHASEVNALTCMPIGGTLLWCGPTGHGDAISVPRASASGVPSWTKRHAGSNGISLDIASDPYGNQRQIGNNVVPIFAFVVPNGDAVSGDYEGHLRIVMSASYTAGQSNPVPLMWIDGVLVNSIGFGRVPTGAGRYLGYANLDGNGNITGFAPQ